MAAPVAGVHQFAQCITCHAWSPDQSMVAFCPNNTEIHIYKLVADNWEKVHVLQKHDQLIASLDWSIKTNRIVSASHDRNSYVWNLEMAEWVATPVVLRLNRAALCVRWSPIENKFAVGSGDKAVCVCYYEQENNWWISKLIRKKHNSSVTSVAWHPNNVLLATTSTDGKCRVFSTFIKGVDTRESGTDASDSKFGEKIIQLDLSYTWTFGVKWSPCGKTLAYTEIEQTKDYIKKHFLTKDSRYFLLPGHSSMIYFVDDVGPSPSAQSLPFRHLPLRDILFLSEKMVIGVGFDCDPMVFAADERGTWSFIRFLDEKKIASSSSKYGSQFSEAFGKFYGQSKHGSSNDLVEPSKPRGGAHENCITCIIPLKKEKEKTTSHFSTSGLDGRIVIWDLGNYMDIIC